MTDVKTISYRVVLEPAEEGGYVVDVPALPGCLTQGETYEDAIEMAKDAILCYIEGLIKHNEPIPTDEPETAPLETRVEIESPVLV